MRERRVRVASAPAGQVWVSRGGNSSSVLPQVGV